VALSVFLVGNRGLSQEKAARVPEATATGLGQPLLELQREIGALRAAGKTKDADSLQSRAQQMLSALLTSFRRTQSLAKQRHDPTGQRLAEARTLVAQVQAEVGPDAAEPLAKQLAAIEQSLQDGKTLVETNDEGKKLEPEVHLLRIDSGVALPSEFVEGRDHCTMGYAEVELAYTARPVILVLQSGRPTLWNIKRNDSRLHAIVRQDANQEILGAGDCLVLDNQAGLSLPQITGRATATGQVTAGYDGATLTIGPSNRVRLSHALLPHIASVASQAKAMLTSQRLTPHKDVRFTALHQFVGQQFGPPVSGRSVGQFSIAGPIANSWKPLPEALRMPIVISGGEIRFASRSIGMAS